MIRRAVLDRAETGRLANDGGSSASSLLRARRPARESFADTTRDRRPRGLPPARRRPTCGTRSIPRASPARRRCRSLRIGEVHSDPSRLGPCRDGRQALSAVVPPGEIDEHAPQLQRGQVVEMPWAVGPERFERAGELCRCLAKHVVGFLPSPHLGKPPQHPPRQNSQPLASVLDQLRSGLRLAGTERIQPVGRLRGGVTDL